MQGRPGGLLSAGEVTRDAYDRIIHPALIRRVGNTRDTAHDPADSDCIIVQSFSVIYIVVVLLLPDIYGSFVGPSLRPPIASAPFCQLLSVSRFLLTAVSNFWRSYPCLLSFRLLVYFRFVTIPSFWPSTKHDRPTSALQLHSFCRIVVPFLGLSHISHAFFSNVSFGPNILLKGISHGRRR